MLVMSNVKNFFIRMSITEYMDDDEIGLSSQGRAAAEGDDDDDPPSQPVASKNVVVLD